MKWLVSGKLTSKGQITLPKLIRQKLNVVEGDLISFGEDDNGHLYLEKVNRGQTCTLCQNGFIALTSTQEATSCPICHETRIIQATNEEEWLKLGIDFACQFNLQVSITQRKGLYQLHYSNYEQHLDKILIEQGHDLIQLGLIREKLKQSSASQIKFILKKPEGAAILYTEQGKQLLKKLIQTH